MLNKFGLLAASHIVDVSIDPQDKCLSLKGVLYASY